MENLLCNQVLDAYSDHKKHNSTSAHPLANPWSSNTRHRPSGCSNRRCRHQTVPGSRRQSSGSCSPWACSGWWFVWTTRFCHTHPCRRQEQREPNCRRGSRQSSSCRLFRLEYPSYLGSTQRWCLCSSTGSSSFRRGRLEEPCARVGCSVGLFRLRFL